MEQDIMNVWFKLEKKGYTELQFFRGQQYCNMCSVIHRWWELVRKSSKVFAKDGTPKRFNSAFPLRLIKKMPYDERRKTYDKVLVNIDYSSVKGLYVSSVEMIRKYKKAEIYVNLSFQADKIPTIRTLVLLMNKTDYQQRKPIKNPLLPGSSEVQKIAMSYDLTTMRRIKNGMKY